MDDPKQIAIIFDNWAASLSPEQQDWCRRAIINAFKNLRNVGEDSAKELVASILLFYDDKRARSQDH